jgi:hypothetical protein
MSGRKMPYMKIGGSWMQLRPIFLARDHKTAVDFVSHLLNLTVLVHVSIIMSFV